MLKLMAKSLKIAGLSRRSFNRYFSVSTDYRPKLEALLACSQMLGINQVVAHNGNGGRECIGETGTVFSVMPVTGNMLEECSAWSIKLTLCRA
ncbi:DUF4049 domain-containing protein [Shigella flexneri]